MGKPPALMNLAARQTHAAQPVQRLIDAADGWLSLGLPEVAWEIMVPLWPALGQNPAALHQKARVPVALGRIQEARQTIACLSKIAPHRRLAVLDDPELGSVWT